MGIDDAPKARFSKRAVEARERGAVLPWPPQYDLPFSTVQVLDERRLNQPIRWTAPRAIFVGSMADLFHEDVPDVALDRIFAVMALTPQHEYMLLTKRPERMRNYIETRQPGGQHHSIGFHMGLLNPDLPDRFPFTWPLPNVGLMVTAEDQQRANERIPVLLDTPAVWRGISVEPMLADITLEQIDAETAGHHDMYFVNVLTGRHTDMGRPARPLPGLDWVICGGESGEGSRPFDLHWARGVQIECQINRVPFFMKQIGSAAEDFGRPVRAGHHGTDMERWPEELRERQWPQHAITTQPKGGG